MVQNPAPTLTNLQQGIAGIYSAGYVTPDQLQDKLLLQQKEFEIRQLQERINAIQQEKENGGMIGSIMKVLNGNPDISKSIATLISGFAGKVMPQPQNVVNAKVGTIGLHPENNADRLSEQSTDDQPLPEHLEKLSEEDFIKIQEEMQTNCLQLWAIDPDFPNILPKLFELASKEKGKYDLAKTFLK